jgi:elongation factor P
VGISISDLRPSITINYNNELYTVLECEHAKLGRGGSFCRVKLKNLRTSAVCEFTLRDSDDIQEAFIERRKLQYLYHESDMYHFLDLETYEDLVLDKSRIEDKIMWLKDNLELTGLFYNSELINLELPISIELKVIETEPGFKGNTVKLATKPAKLETGVVVQVPIFIDIGDIIKIDTRTKEYIGRA